MQKTAEIDPTIAQINKRLGRPLRVLHIGNIANNAYNNAKIQRSYGIEADVLCYDYYHVMATPEWEDADLDTKVDPALPDWWSTNLRGFRRPSWFVQGPAALCVNYLVARAKGHRFMARLRKWGLEAAYWNLLEDRAKQVGVARQCPGKRRNALHRWVSIFDPWMTLKQRLAPAFRSLRNRVLVPLLIAATAKPPVIRGARALIALWQYRLVLLKRPSPFDRRSILGDLVEADIISAFSIPRIVGSAFWIACRASFAVLIFAVVVSVRLITTRGQVVRKDTGEREKLANELVAKFQRSETSVSEGVWDEFRRYLIEHALNFGPVLASYDIVQGYSIDGIIPLSNGFQAFSAYEHGTLRDIPFDDTLLGLLCRVVYRSAPSIFITNSDVIGSADRLGLESKKICFLPHAFDDVKLDRFRQGNISIPDRETVEFFCPSRQHWRDQNPSLTKGSDLMLRAAANVAAEGHRFRLVLVEWGMDVDASKALVSELGIEQLVSWIPPMNKKSLWHQYCRSHAVLDQFSLPALGGVGFEVLALGRRLITKIDVDQLKLFFGCAPPVFSGTDVMELTNSIRSVVLDPEDKAQKGMAGRQWIKDYHSARRIVALQANVYLSLIGEKLSVASS
jgi:hypothetical protein